MAEESQESTTTTANNQAPASLEEAIKNITPIQTGTQHKQFVAEPFHATELAKEVALPSDEAKSTETAATETKATEEAKTEATAEATPDQEATKVEDKPTEETAVEQIPESEFVAMLNEAIADPEISFNELAEIKALIEENRQFKEAASQLQGLTQEERARIEIGREYGDFGLYDRITSIDTASLTPKEAMKQVFFLENIGKNTQLLEKQFEREYTKKYEEDPDEDYSKMLLKQDGEDAIKALIGAQADLKKRGQISGGVDPEVAKKAKQKEDEAWLAAVDTVINKNKKATHTFADGLAIHSPVKDKDVPLIRDYCDRPIEFLRSLITDKDGKYDHDKLWNVVVRNVYWGDFMDEARKAGAAIKEESFLKEKKNADVIKTPAAGDAEAKFDALNALAASIRGHM
jgi:hypothetical protein